MIQLSDRFRRGLGPEFGTWTADTGAKSQFQRHTLDVRYYNYKANDQSDSLPLTLAELLQNRGLWVILG